ncbi:acid phosphatase type 7-like [Apostichopus japonicus]|uniref:acid phosphatase type 7-like n=1 Tax=Stichopus japonicus TaxID=307972 RepID=UPI003AB74102
METLHVALFLLVWTELQTLSRGDIPYLTQPEQVHISATGNPTEMMVTWNTVNSTNISAVEFGLNGEFSKTTTGYSSKFTEPEEGRVQYIHRVLLSGLKPGKVYTYHCGSPEGWSSLFYFKAQLNTTDWSPRFAVFGDLGNENAQSLGRLQEETQKGMYDVFLHIGDFAYNMYQEGGRVGDSFMRQIETIAAYVPYMTCPGNHEQYYNFTNYKNRFSMPNFNQSENLWYSWNIGPAHIISFSTEVYFFPWYGLHASENQMAWLQKDLQEASKPENRKRRPWIITMGHRPAYCTNSNHNDCTLEGGLVKRFFEELFYKYGVDLELWAHEHTYERLWPVYGGKVYNGTVRPYTDPKAPVHIITGSAGNRERHDGFGPQKEWSAFRSSDYGYTRMVIHNATHLSLEQVSDDQGGKLVDSITVIKHKHGFDSWQ